MCYMPMQKMSMVQKNIEWKVDLLSKTNLHNPWIYVLLEFFFMHIPTYSLYKLSSVPCSFYLKIYIRTFRLVWVFVAHLKK